MKLHQSRRCHSGTARRAGPEIHTPRLCLWIPGSRLAARPGMTAERSKNYRARHRPGRGRDRPGGRLGDRRRRATWRRRHSSSRSCAARPATGTPRTAGARPRASAASARSGGTGRRAPTLAAVAISDTMPSAFGLAITLGAYCGSISTMSAPIAFRRASPSCSSVACGSTALSRSTELVPTCQSTRSGFSAITAVSRRASMSAASSPLTPRLSTVISWPGNRRVQLVREPARIGGGGRARAGAEGRRGAERDDLDRLAGGERPRGAHAAEIEARLFGRHLAARLARRGGGRRWRRQRGRGRGGSRDLRTGRREREKGDRGGGDQNGSRREERSQCMCVFRPCR